MKNTMKKILLSFVIIITAMVCFAFSATALAETGKCGDNLYWDYDVSSGELIIYGEGAMYNNVHDGSPFYNSKIRTIVIKDGVTSIGDRAFWKCSYLESIVFCDSLTSIGECAFLECTKIEKLEIPEAVTLIEDSAFLDCSNLKSVKLPKDLTSIKGGTFADCINLTEIIFPENITSIGQQAFQGCDSLTEFRFPDGVEIVETLVLSGCVNLEKVYIPSSAKTIYFSAFTYCKKLKYIEIDDGNINYCSDENGVVYSKDKTILKFYPTGKTDKEFTIPNGVKTIGGGAFCGVFSNTQNTSNGSYCNRSLQTVAIPRTVTEIKKCAFFYYISLKDVVFLGTETEWKDIKIGDLNFYKSSPTFYYLLKELFPAGYNFYEDSYSFGNYDDPSLSKKYFTSLFCSANAEEIYKGNKNASGGLCYGMASSTAAIYSNLPPINSIYNKSLTGSTTFANNLRDVEKISKLNIGDKTISVSDYIKYSYVYQYSEDVMLQRDSTRFLSEKIQGEESDYNKNGIFELYELIKTVTKNNGLRVIIILDQTPIVENGYCHAVLCVGVDNNSILIDDSNLRPEHGFNDELAHLTINEDGSWVYGPYNGIINSSNTVISYTLDCYKPYEILLTGEKVLADDHWLGNNNNTGNNYIVGCEKLDVGKGILYCDAENYELNEFERTEILDIASGENNIEQEGKLYWVNENEKISITNIENSDENAEFHFSSGETIAEAVISDGSSITFDSDKSMKIDSEINEDYTVSYVYCFEDENYNDNVIRVSVLGIASNEIIEVENTDDGVAVTGISDGTVTLTKNDEVIETQEIKDAVGEIEITYDKTGEDEDVELDYHSHSYSSSITTPATHTAEGIETFLCSCGDSYTKPVAKLEGHTHTVTNTVAPTCTKNGLTVYTCACGNSYTATIPAAGHSHGDDGICKNCGEYNKAYDKTLSDSENCSHLCHQSGFMGFIWMIVRVFIKLFKTNPVCECGAAHY